MYRSLNNGIFAMHRNRDEWRFHDATDLTCTTETTCELYFMAACCRRLNFVIHDSFHQSICTDLGRQN
jgi:hypothetical protein